MAQPTTLTGIVLKASPAGEYDRRIVLLTKEQGKITAFVRGGRRPKSALQAATSLFAFGTFEAYEGREAYTVVKADIRHYFRELYGDWEKSTYGCYFLEVADAFTQPAQEAGEQLALLYKALQALSVQSLSPRLVRMIYELKTLAFAGVSPHVFSCVKCGSKEQLGSFSMQRHGMLCENCALGQVVMSPAALYTLQFVIATPAEKVFTFTLSEAVFEETNAIVEGYFQLYADREFHSLEMLKVL